MSLGRKHATLRRLSLEIPASLLLCLSPAFSQQPARDGGAPKYDQKTESKAKGVIDEIKTLTLGSRKDFIQLIVKDGTATYQAYVCPKPYQDEMGISFNKGDEITLTGSKVKLQDLDIVLVRELAKGTDTFVFRDSKGDPVWDWRTGK